MKFDVAIIGGGPAGLSACIFAQRAGLKTICFEKLAFGGQAVLSTNIENYPAFKSISGFELTQQMFNHAKECGTEFVFGEVLKVRKNKNNFSIKTRNKIYYAQKIVVASGTNARKLGANEKKYIGKGVSYCASCDGNFFKGKDVAVVGGGDSAFVYAEYLSKLCHKVYILNRTDRFRANPMRVETVKKLTNVKLLKNVEIETIQGKEVVSSLKLKNGKTLKVDGVFVAIGHIPNLDFLNFDVETDNNGYIIVDKYMKTNVENVFACGDILSKHFKQVITACADGAIAGNSCVGETNAK